MSLYHPHDWDPGLTRDFGKSKRPWLPEEGRHAFTLERGSVVPVSFKNSHWDYASKHAILYFESTPVAVPARAIGGLLRWAESQAVPPRRPWHGVEFWLYRSIDGEWGWFLEESAKAMVYLPWKQMEARGTVAGIMNS